MTRASTAIDTIEFLAVALELEASRAQTSLTACRRILGFDPKPIAKAKTSREMNAASQVPTVMRMNEDGVAIADESVATYVATRGGADVHHVAREQYRPMTPDRAMALKLLRSVPPPLTTTRVARALVWTEERARYWLSFFASKGVLAVSRDGHTWSQK